MDIFRQQPVSIAKLERIDKALARLLLSTRHPKRVDQPEAADQECSLRKPKITQPRIAHHMLPPPQFTLHRLQRINESGVIWFNQAKFREQQHAGIEIIAANCGG